MSQSTIEQQKKAAAASAAVQQSDNIAHALSGAGGGILSMALTCVHPSSLFPAKTHTQELSFDSVLLAATL